MNRGSNALSLFRIDGRVTASPGRPFPAEPEQICVDPRSSAAHDYGAWFSILADGSIALLLIHHVDQRLAGGEAFDVLAGGAYHAGVVLIASSGHMRRDDHVIEFP